MESVTARVSKRRQSHFTPSWLLRRRRNFVSAGFRSEWKVVVPFRVGSPAMWQRGVDWFSSRKTYPCCRWRPGWAAPATCAIGGARHDVERTWRTAALPYCVAVTLSSPSADCGQCFFFFGEDETKITNHIYVSHSPRRDETKTKMKRNKKYRGYICGNENDSYRAVASI